MRHLEREEKFAAVLVFTAVLFILWIYLVIVNSLGGYTTFTCGEMNMTSVTDVEGGTTYVCWPTQTCTFECYGYEGCKFRVFNECLKSFANTEEDGSNATVWCDGDPVECEGIYNSFYYRSFLYNIFKDQEVIIE